MPASTRSGRSGADHTTRDSSLNIGAPTAPTTDRQTLQVEQLTHVLTGHGGAFARCFFQWASSHSITRADARDAIQTVLVKLAQRLRKNQATTVMLSAPWLFRCAMREAVRNHKRSATVRLHGLRAEAVPGVWEQYRQTARQDQLDAVAEALAQLPERERAVLTLHQVNEQSEEEIAAQFGVTQGTVSRWLVGARARLRREVVLILIRQGYERDELPK
jgi:RNA polymerase sigma factor (sigma-70 family)